MSQETEERTGNFLLPEGRLAFVDDSFPNSKGQYEAVVLVPMNQDTDGKIKELENILADFSKEACGSDHEDYWGGCVQDGSLVNEKREQKGKEALDGYDDHWVIKARSKFEPGVLDSDKNRVANPKAGRGKDLYSGCWAFVTVNPGRWEFTDENNRKSEGVKLYLCNLYITDLTAEPFGGQGGVDPDSEFEGVTSSRKPEPRGRDTRRRSDQASDRDEAPRDNGRDESPPPRDRRAEVRTSRRR